MRLAAGFRPSAATGLALRTVRPRASRPKRSREPWNLKLPSSNLTVATTAELVLAAQEGDNEAFGDAGEPLRADGQAVCWQRLRNHAEAQEAAQEVFIKALREARAAPGAGGVSGLVAVDCRPAVDQPQHASAAGDLRSSRTRWKAFDGEVEAPLTSLLESRAGRSAPRRARSAGDARPQHAGGVLHPGPVARGNERRVRGAGRHDQAAVARRSEAAGEGTGVPAGGVAAIAATPNRGRVAVDLQEAGTSASMAASRLCLLHRRPDRHRAVRPRHRLATAQLVATPRSPRSDPADDKRQPAQRRDHAELAPRVAGERHRVERTAEQRDAHDKQRPRRLRSAARLAARSPSAAIATSPRA